MSDIQARPNTLPWPPIIYTGSIAAAVLLRYLYPLPWITEPLSSILFVVGILGIAAVVAIYYSAITTMKKANTTIAPHKGSDHLVTTGAFSFTRNPLYFANTLLMVSVGLIAGIVWFLVLAVIAAFLTQKLAIEREEKHLEVRFGKRYRDYAKRVRRWI